MRAHDPDPAAQQDRASRLASSFRDAAGRHERLLLDIDEGEPESPGLDAEARERLAGYHGGDGILPTAIGLIAAQSVARASGDLEALLHNAPGRLRTSDEAMALLLALFLVGRAVADGGAQIMAGPCRFGEHLQGLENLLIEPDVSLGDFPVDFLLTYTEMGPNPEHGRDPSQPAGITEEHRLALIRDEHDAGAYHDRMVRRTALPASFGVTVVSYDDEEVRRDPFALAYRTIRDLSTRVHDRLYGTT
jgi:hypothetical protein